MNIIEAMAKTINEAKTKGNLYYLHFKDGNYFISPQFQKDWLFRAYPGGRKELSTKGSQIVQKEINRVIW